MDIPVWRCLCFADYQGGSGSDDSGGSGGESDSDSSSGAESVQEVGHT